MKRLYPVFFAFINACVPLLPAFITLTAVTVPGVSLVPTAAAIALLALAAAVGVTMLVSLLTPPREAPPTLVPLLLWLAAVVLAAVLGFNPRGGILFICIFGLGIVWHVSTLRFYRVRFVAGAIFWSFLISGLLASVAAVVMALLRLPADQYTIGHGRAIGTFILPGELAGYLIVYLSIAYGVAVATRAKALRIVAWIGLAVGCIALAMSFSRAGWVGFAAAIAFYLFATRSRDLRRPTFGPILIGSGAVLVGIAAVLIVFNAHHNPSENYTRLSIWQAAAEIIQRFPLTGVGPFNFASAYALVRLPDGDATAFHAHSFLLTVFAETGLVGLAAVIFAWGRFAQILWERLRGASPLQTQLALAIAAGLVGTWVQGLIDTVSVVIFGLWLPTMALALAVARDGLMEEER
jgi:O-antigen ligase